MVAKALHDRVNPCFAPSKTWKPHAFRSLGVLARVFSALYSTPCSFPSECASFRDLITWWPMFDCTKWCQDHFKKRPGCETCAAAHAQAETRRGDSSEGHCREQDHRISGHSRIISRVDFQSLRQVTAPFAQPILKAPSLSLSSSR